MSVTPDFIGQIYKDTATGNLWRANSLAAGDWTLEVQNMLIKWAPTTVKVGEFMFFGFYDNTEVTELELLGETCGGIEITTDSALESFSSTTVETIEGSYAPLYIDSCDVLATLDFPLVTHIQDGLTVVTCPLLASINLPLLATAGPQLIQTCPLLTSINLDSLATTTGSFQIIVCAILPSVILPAFVSSGGDTAINSCASLTTISMPLWVPGNGNDHSFDSNALNVASVNHLLARGVANPGFVSGTLSLEGGANAAPSGQGIADKATLIGRGVTVTTN